MGESAIEVRLRGWAPAICRSFAYFSGLALGGSLVSHALRHSSSLLGLFEDDFFYYVVIADHLVTLGKLTFDGVTPTNGFHPLWFAVITLLRVLTGGFGTAFFVLFGISCAALIAAAYEALRLLAERIGAPRPYAAALALLQVSLVMWLVASGMEVAIAIPIFAWLLAEVARDAPLGPGRAAKLGGLASLAVLARVDLLLAVGVLVCAWLAFVRPWPTRPLRSALAFAAGCLPLLGYFGANLLFFGDFLPTSGRAKQLGSGLRSGARFITHFESIVSPSGLLVLLLGSVGLVLLVRRRATPPSAPARVAAGAGLAFPLLFGALNAARSDWYVFIWYGYPMVTGLLSACALLVVWAEPLLAKRTVARLLGAVLAFAVLLVPMKSALYFARRGIAWTDADNTLLPMARTVAHALQGHPGRVAMGDKAGITTFLLQRPIVQLEGLVEGQAMLTHIQRGDSLNTVLDEYGADYLVVSTAVHSPQKSGQCYEVTAPNPDQAGSSPEMHGKLCAEPLLHFKTPSGPHAWWTFAALDTFVFDLRKERALKAQVN
jgi:hypothetical protein